MTTTPPTPTIEATPTAFAVITTFHDKPGALAVFGPAGAPDPTTKKGTAA